MDHWIMFSFAPNEAQKVGFCLFYFITIDYFKPFDFTSAVLIVSQMLVICLIINVFYIELNTERMMSYS